MKILTTLASLLGAIMLSACVTPPPQQPSPAPSPGGSTPPKVCTMIGCENSVSIKLPRHLKKRPGTYFMKLAIDNEPVRRYKVTINDKSGVCPAGDQHTPVKQREDDHVFIALDMKVCSTPRPNGGNVYGVFSGFKVVNVERPEILKLTLRDASGRVVFKADKQINSASYEVLEPNGPGCGQCFQNTIDLR